MRQKILGICICLFIITAILPVDGTLINENIQINKINRERDILISSTPFWKPDHYITILIDKLYVYSDEDSGNEDGEYFFHIFSFPRLFLDRTNNFNVNDKNPDNPYHPGVLTTFKVRFTPQHVILFAVENDKGEGKLNFNDFMDLTTIKINPPKGDYPPGDPWVMDPIIWENIYFKAVVKIHFGQK